MQIASPGKLVQSDARTWPIYKCMVNKNWETTQMAHVWIMRKHDNNNLTVGIYTIDLLCMGIRDTEFFFNVPEQECMQQFSDVLPDCIAIDYNLAHNIVFAGYDFALGFDISPHTDFNITRFILEEDDSAIPLIEVPVGVNGIPHLIVEKSGQHATILARLKQYAGEGNYYYTVAGDDALFASREVDATGTLMISDIPEGDINLGNVHSIRSEDMLDNAQVQQRSVQEQVTLHAELLTRLLPPDLKEGSTEDETRWDELWEEMIQGAADPNHVPADHFEEYVQLAQLVGDLTALLDRNNPTMMSQFEEGLLGQLHSHAQSPLAIQLLYEHGVLLGSDIISATAKVYAQKLCAQYPLLQCSLALGALVQGQPNDQFNNLYTRQQIREAIPGYQQYHALEIVNFWLIKLWMSLDNNDIRNAVQYYYLLADARANAWLLMPVLEKYVEVLYNYNLSLNKVA